MKIDIFDNNKLNDCISNDESIEISDDISSEDLIRSLDLIVSFKEKEENKEKEIHLNLKSLSSDKMVEAYKFWMKDDVIVRLRDAQTILNIIILLKTYNTFDSTFFEHPTVFISSMEKFLDVKLALQQDIRKLNCQIADYFISIIRSLNKTEYTMLDSYVEMPYFYKSLFMSIDLVTISGILSTIPNDYRFNMGFVKDANTYMVNITKSYVMSDSLMNMFIGGRNDE